MNSWKAILAALVIFGAGGLTGGVLSWRIREANVLQRPHRASQPGSPGGWRLEFLRRAQRELDLSPEQRERVDKILKESQERSRMIMEPISPQIRAEMQRTKDEFRSVLTPQQQKRFDELLKKPSHPRDQRRSQSANGSKAP
ncbi:MAG TPA: hypothetical protein VJA21_07405 [Verrucomicrobiae bacterium]